MCTHSVSVKFLRVSKLFSPVRPKCYAALAHSGSFVTVDRACALLSGPTVTLWRWSAVKEGGAQGAL